MSWKKWLTDWRFRQVLLRGACPTARKPKIHLQVETLEGRVLPAASFLPFSSPIINTSVQITISGTDEDNDFAEDLPPAPPPYFRFQITSVPQHGTLNVDTSSAGFLGTVVDDGQLDAAVVAVVTYTPNTNWTGPDSFTFVAIDPDGNITNDQATSSSATVNVTTVKATPVITWANPADITYGTPLGATQLDAMANTPGTFNYTLADGTTPASGAVLQAGTIQTLIANFTPSNTTVFQGASASQTINVDQATTAITWPNPADIVYGTPLDSMQLDATATAVVNGATVQVPGTFNYTLADDATSASGVYLDAGAGQTLNVNFTPTDATDFTAPTSQAAINVTPASQAITSFNFVSDVTFNSVTSPVTYGATPIVLEAEGGDSGNFVTFSVISGPGYLPGGNVMSYTGVGTIVVEADQAGSLDYYPAPPVQETLVVNPTYSYSLSENATGTRSAISVSTLLGMHFSDAEKTTKPGIAVTQASGAGAWQYFNGAAWTNMTAVSENTALLLPKTDLLRFLPAGLDTGTADLLFDAWDGSTGSNGGRASVYNRAGGTAFSDGAGLLTVNVNPVTAAPVWLATTTTLVPVLPGASPPTGESVQQAFGALFSADDGQNPGVAVVGLTGTASGTWQYALYDSGTGSFGAFQVIPPKTTASTALLLGAQDLIAFVPTSPTFVGTATLLVRAWDGTTGADGTLTNLSKSTSIGGKTAFSSAILTAKVYVNQAPVQNPPPAGITLTATNENVISKTVAVSTLLKDAAASDPDKGTSLGLAIIDTEGQGIWQYVFPGHAWTALPNGPSANAYVLLPATASLRFVPFANTFADVNSLGHAALSWYAWDGTQGTAGTQGFDIAATGGPTAFSSASATATLAVNRSMNTPAPVWTGTGATLTPVVPNSTPPGDRLPVVFGNFETPVFLGIAVSGVTGQANGMWEYSSDDGTTWTGLNSVSPTKAILLAAGDFIRFRPTKLNFVGSATLTAHAWSAVSGQDGDVVNLTLKGMTGGISDISAGTLTATCVVNTAPTLSA